MKYLILLLLSFNLQAACLTNTVENISKCTARDKVGSMIGEMSTTGGPSFSDDGLTLEERFDNSSPLFKAHVKKIMFFWKVRESFKKIDCSLIPQIQTKKMCYAFKGN